MLKKYVFYHFFRQVEFFSKKVLRKNPNLADPSCGYAGGPPPGRGVENARQDPGYRFCGFFSKTNFFENKFVQYAPPPRPPHGPPLDPPIFFNFGPQEPPFIFFSSIILCLFITVFLFIFSLFLFTFFSIIEGRAVVIQPPQHLFKKGIFISFRAFEFLMPLATNFPLVV